MFNEASQLKWWYLLSSQLHSKAVQLRQQMNQCDSSPDEHSSCYRSKSGVFCFADKTFNQLGQALLEVTIASGLAVIIISAISVTTIIGLRNSQYAQNQIQATKFAQEGIEQIKYIQNRNCPVTDQNAYQCVFSPDPTNPTIDNCMWEPAASTPFVFSGNFTPTITDSVCRAVASAQPEILSAKNFKRTITLSRDICDASTSTCKIKVNSQVSWTDYSGPHQSSLTTILVAN